MAAVSHSGTSQIDPEQPITFLDSRLSIGTTGTSVGGRPKPVQVTPSITSVDAPLSLARGFVS
jgi:hypothetical protein